MATVAVDSTHFKLVSLFRLKTYNLPMVEATVPHRQAAARLLGIFFSNHVRKASSDMTCRFLSTSVKILTHPGDIINL